MAGLPVAVPLRCLPRGGVVTLTNPDCRDGKHRACAGDAWDYETDQRVWCRCKCHDKEEA